MILPKPNGDNTIATKSDFTEYSTAPNKLPRISITPNKAIKNGLQYLPRTLKVTTFNYTDNLYYHTVTMKIGCYE
jgi:hypothetical protein